MASKISIGILEKHWKKSFELEMDELILAERLISNANEKVRIVMAMAVEVHLPPSHLIRFQSAQALKKSREKLMRSDFVSRY